MSNILPKFSLPNQDEETVTNETIKNSYTILYFYPRDNTSGCSTEAIEFTANKKKFEKLDCKIIGVSADTIKKHQNFIEKKELKIELLSDTNQDLLESCGVWKLKKMAGKEYMGIVRTTLIVSPEGEILHRWDKVKVKGHVENVLETLKELV